MGGLAHMRVGSRADEAVANLVRSGRKQPQRYCLGSFRLPLRFSLGNSHPPCQPDAGGL